VQPPVRVASRNFLNLCLRRILTGDPGSSVQSGAGIRTAKLLGHPHTAMFDGLQLFSLMGVAGVLELVGGLLVALGLFTRPVAFILSGEMAVAYFIAHAPQGFLPLVKQGEAAVLYCFFFLYLFVAGPGAFSIDAIRNKA
jgi:putative oxidoreductase